MRRHLASGAGAHLCFVHGPKVFTCEHHQEHQKDRQKRVETVGDGIQEQTVGRRGDAFDIADRFINQPHLKTDPGGDHRNRGHGRCSGIHQVGQLLPGYSQFVAHRAGCVTHNQRVGVVIEKDTQSKRRNYRLHPTRSGG